MKVKGLKILLLVTVFLMLVIGSVQATGQPEGCTPGYWKNHLDAWVGYQPGASFIKVFDPEGFGIDYDKTLLEALETGGGGEKALGRHAAAALSNAQQLNYRWDTEEIISMVQWAHGWQIFEDKKDQLEEYNEQFCPLD